MIKFTRASKALLACTALCAMWSAQAASYPNRPISIIVPYPPGGSTDILARAAAEELGKELNQSVIVENRPGAFTTIAIMAVKRAAPDGHTILLTSDGFFSGVYAVKNVGYKPEDFVPISPLSRTPFALIAPAGIPSKSMKEYLQYARENADKMNYGVMGSGLNIYKLLGESFTKSTNISWTDITYKGGVEGIQAIMANQIQAMFSTVSLVVPQQKQPHINILAVTDTKRSPYLPTVPTFKELGYPEVIASSIFGLAVRAETPIFIQEKLRASLRRVLESENMKSRIRTLSLELYEGTLENYKNDENRIKERYAEQAKKLGVRTN